MKATVTRMLVPVALAGMLVSGCAAVNTGDEPMVRREVDRDYVAAVERAARGMPVEIVWVNPPTKEVERPAKGDADVEKPQN